jgi:hypothetical protein
MDPMKLVSHRISVSNYPSKDLSTLKRISQSIIELEPTICIVSHSWRVIDDCPICTASEGEENEKKDV